MGLLNKWFSKWVSANQDKLLTAMHKVNYGGDMSDLETVTQDYYALLKAVHKGEKPKEVLLDPEDYYLMVVDGVPYDLDELISHNDQRNTGRKMEIEALMGGVGGGIDLSAVQQRLNMKVQWNWDKEA